MGDKEQEDKTVTVRYRDTGASKTLSQEDFLTELLDAINNKK